MIINEPTVKEIIGSPAELNYKSVVYWSEHYQQLQVPEGEVDAIRAKAKHFLRENCIDYDKENKCFIVNPIKGYNKTSYKVFSNNSERGFTCSCQFYNKVVEKSDNPYFLCSHILAVYLYLKMKHWNNKNGDN